MKNNITKPWGPYLSNPPELSNEAHLKAILEKLKAEDLEVAYIAHDEIIIIPNKEGVETTFKRLKELLST